MDKEISNEYLDKINILQGLIQSVDPKLEIYKSTSKQLEDLKKVVESIESNSEELVNVSKK